MVLKPSVSWVRLGSTGDWGAEVLEEQLLQRQGFGKRRKQERKTLSVLLFHPWSSCCSLLVGLDQSHIWEPDLPHPWQPESRELRDAGDQGGSPGNRGRADTRFGGKQSTTQTYSLMLWSFTMFYNIFITFISVVILYLLQND